MTGGPVNGPWSTEQVNPRTVDLDRLSTAEVVRLLHAEDHAAVSAVDAVLPQVAQAADWAAEAYEAGGRWIFVGAGTSGRIGFTEAAECPPTFGTPADRIIAVMAGGVSAFQQAAEGAEDDEEAGRQAIRDLAVADHDVVLGLAASGRTPYVLGAVRQAKAVKARTIGITSVAGSLLAHEADLAITPATGAEAVLGSTRLKAGTAQKLVTNMITTAAMIRLGRVYRNLMVDLRATNQKLKDRAIRLVALGALISEDDAKALLTLAAGEVKTAIVMSLLKVDAQEARQRLAGTGGRIAELLA